MQTTYNTKALLSRAKEYPPSEPRARASSFANWVFKLSHDPTREVNTRSNYERKSKSHPFTSGDIASVANYLARERGDERLSNGWSIEYADLGNDASENFVASRLVIGDKALRCRPDGVMRHEATGEILIIERKIAGKITESKRPMPENSWPNIRAQLWCYSWIDDWVNASKITLMADVWHRNHIAGGLSPPKVRPFWDRKDEVWQECEKLFHFYGGHVERL